LQQRLRRAASQGANYFRPDYVNLTEKKRRAGRDFVFFREAIFGRAAFHHIAYVNIFSAQAHGFNHLREQFSRAANEWFAFYIFVVTGTFADENQFGFQAADSKYDVGARFVEFAARAIADGFANKLKRVVFNPIASFEK
jgi:hypothetical protein